MLFGSFAKGEDTKKSDVDIAIIGAKKREVELRSFEEILGKEIRINYYSSFGEIKKELRNNILGGLLVSGWVDL